MSRRQFFLAIFFSLLIHLFLVGLGVTVSILIPPEDRVVETAKQKPIEVTLLPKGIQIADIAPPKEEKIPEKARFVGEYDSAVKEETVAPTRRTGGGSRKKERPPTLEKTLKEKLAPKKGASLAMKAPEKKAEPPAEKKLPGGGEDFFNGGASEDFFPDYKFGDHTYLNVLKYPKIGYFVRLKKAFRTTFNPVPALRGSLTRVSHGQIDVVLAVTVDRMGKLAGLQVIRSSGISSYDQEAVRTVRDSAPFATPPSDLLDGESLLRMAWTFTVYL